MTHSSLQSDNGMIIVNPQGKLYHGIKGSLPALIKKTNMGLFPTTEHGKYH